MDPSMFSFFPPRPAQADVACLDQTESTTATIAGLDLSDPISSAPATATTLTSYMTPIVSTEIPQLQPATVRHPRPARTPSHRRDEGPAKKRVRIDDSPEFEFESVGYWLRFEEDETETEMANDAFDTVPPGRKSELRSLNRSAARSSAPPLVTRSHSTSKSTPQFRELDLLDESAWDHTMSDENDDFDSLNLADEMAKLDSAPPTEVPPREGLYSTPLSWEQPQPGLQLGPPLPAGPAVLSDAERRRLLDIAMNTGRQSSSFLSGLDLGFAGGFAPWGAPSLGEGSRPSRIVESPEQFAPPKPEPADFTIEDIKRKSSASPSSPSSLPPHQLSPKQAENAKEKARSDRTGHNDIERKYRTNLKDKIAELRDAVPALRSMVEDGGDETEAHRASKVSKGTILMKAAEYIRYLERRNKAIKREHQELETRLHAFEQLMTAAAKQSFLLQNHSMTLFDPRGFTS